MVFDKVDPTALLAVDALRASAEQREGGSKNVAALSSSIWSRQFNFDHVFDSQVFSCISNKRTFMEQSGSFVCCKRAT